jgi:hypothetical protein
MVLHVSHIFHKSFHVMYNKSRTTMLSGSICQLTCPAMSVWDSFTQENLVSLLDNW